jgi:hypothetical protein
VDKCRRVFGVQRLIMARHMGHPPPLLPTKPLQVGWVGWAVLHDKLRNGVQPRRVETWYTSTARCRKRRRCWPMCPRCASWWCRPKTDLQAAGTAAPTCW